jgi:hypothetical protein
MEPGITTTKKLKSGYAGLIGAPAAAFDRNGLVFEVLERRAQGAWGGNWFQPIWAVSLGQATVCAVAPEYAGQAKSVMGSFHFDALLSPELVSAVQQCFVPGEWQALEIFYYPEASIALGELQYPVAKLSAGHPEYAAYSAEFSGGSYVILDRNQRIISCAGIKDHGAINEISVATELEYRQKGMGRAVVSRAVADILSRNCVPVYVPDALTNQGSYALARSMGFEKAGEMLLWEVQR